MQAELKELEEKLVIGGQRIEEKEKQLGKKFKDMQESLKRRKEKEKKLLDQQSKKNAKKIEFEKKYASIQEELKDKTIILEKANEKYKCTQIEIEDLNKEHQEEKEQLLHTIRESKQEIDLYKKIVKVVLGKGEIKKIKNKAEWDDETGSWNVPLFTIQNKQTMFPKLPKSQCIFMYIE